MRSLSLIIISALCTASLDAAKAQTDNSSDIDVGLYKTANPIQIAPGYGFDSLLGTIHSAKPCVEGTLDPPTQGTPGGQGNITGFVASSSVEYANQSNLTAAISLGYGIYSAHADREVITSEAGSSFYENAFIKSRWVTDSRRFAAGLTADARRLLDKKDYITFRTICGDRYVSGVSYGAEFSARISVRTTSSTEQQSTRTTLQAAVTGVKFGADATVQTQEEFKNNVQNKDTEFVIYYVGDDLSVVSNATDSCKEQKSEFPNLDVAEINEFAKHINCRVRNKKPLVYNTTSCGDLDSRAAYDGPLSTAKDVANLMKVFVRMAGLRVAIAEDNPKWWKSEFGAFSKAAAQHEADKLEVLIAKWRDVNGTLAYPANDPVSVRWESGLGHNMWRSWPPWPLICGGSRGFPNGHLVQQSVQMQLPI